MNRKTALIVILASFAVLVGFILFVYLINNYKIYSWIPYQYSYRSKQPYGVKYLYKTMKKGEKRKDFTLSNKRIGEGLDTTSIGENYFFIGTQQFLDSADAAHLLKYVANGNKAYIASHNPSGELIRYFSNQNIYSFRYDQIYDSAITVNLYDNESQYDFMFYKHNEPSYYNWKGKDSDFFNNTFGFYGFEKLAEMDSGLVSFFGIQHGEGYFYFDANPLLLGNYYLMNENGYQYANDVLGVLNDGAIYWDNYSRYGYRNMDTSNAIPGKTEGTFSYILSQKSLRWSFYTVLVLLALFILFRSKREQKIIPLVEENKNTSIEYVKAVGTIHYTGGKHRDLSKEIMRQFYGFLRDRYGIATNVENQQLQKMIVLKSGMKPIEVQKIFHQEAKIRHYTSDIRPELIQLYLAVNNFYKNCK